MEISRLAETECDCTSGSVRLLAYIQHAKPIAEGAVLYSRKPLLKLWSVIPNGTPIYDIMKDICAS